MLPRHYGAIAAQAASCEEDRLIGVEIAQIAAELEPVELCECCGRRAWTLSSDLMCDECRRTDWPWM